MQRRAKINVEFTPPALRSQVPPEMQGLVRELTEHLHEQSRRMNDFKLQVERTSVLAPGGGSNNAPTVIVGGSPSSAPSGGSAATFQSAFVKQTVLNNSGAGMWVSFSPALTKVPSVIFIKCYDLTQPFGTIPFDYTGMTSSGLFIIPSQDCTCELFAIASL